MTPEQINRKIAVRCGFIHDPNHHPEAEPEWPWYGPDGLAHFLPDYYHDLNAVHEAENSLKPIHRATYQDYLRVVCFTLNDPTCSNWALFHAAAPQRCEALLRTWGEWEEPK